MSSKLGVYWSVMHRRPQDYAYFSRLQPTIFKIMDGGPPDYRFAKDNLPNSLIIARDWALSEQHSDMLRDPAGTGNRHAREWNQHQARLGFDRAKTLILGINEPRIWEPGVPNVLREYTIALCGEATKLGLRVGAMQLSVGWPANKGPDTPPDWSPWHGVEEAIINNDGALVLHEYWADQGPAENWGWWAGRALKCPWHVPIVIGECGVDMYVKDGSVPQNDRGWRSHLSPEQYAQQLADYTSRMSADARFVGDAVFASDFAAHEWYSFDVEPAYNAILATPIPVAPQPQPTPTETTRYVIATAGANIREVAGLTDGPPLLAVPYGEPVQVAGYRVGADGAQWAQVRYQSVSGWMLAALLGDAPVVNPMPTQQPAPAPSGDNWTRAIAFIRRWEGGFVNDPHDPGGATNKGITLDTYTRWRKMLGQPQPTVEELRNISDAEVDRIYFEWYWKASGADLMPWPLCLIHMDTAVNAGVGRAQEMLQKSGGNFLAYAGHLIDWYTRIDNFERFGRAWIRRRAEILLEATK